MKGTMFVATVFAGVLVSTVALAGQINAPGQFGTGTVGRELPAHYPWEETRGVRPTFGVDVQDEPEVEYGLNTIGRQISSLERELIWREQITTWADREGKKSTRE